jgi:hypothetical protein
VADLVYLAGPDKLTVTSTSKTLAQLGLVWDPSAKGIILHVPAEGVLWNYGLADANSCPLLPGTNQAINPLAKLQTLQVIAAGDDVNIWVEQIG